MTLGQATVSGRIGRPIADRWPRLRLLAVAEQCSGSVAPARATRKPMLSVEQGSRGQRGSVPARQHALTAPAPRSPAWNHAVLLPSATMFLLRLCNDEAVLGPVSAPSAWLPNVALAHREWKSETATPEARCPPDSAVRLRYGEGRLWGMKTSSDRKAERPLSVRSRDLGRAPGNDGVAPIPVVRGITIEPKVRPLGAIHGHASGWLGRPGSGHSRWISATRAWPYWLESVKGLPDPEQV